jgi:hypothetical protein
VRPGGKWSSIAPFTLRTLRESEARREEVLRGVLESRGVGDSDGCVHLLLASGELCVELVLVELQVISACNGGDNRVMEGLR